jgi:WD40 repeat protein
VTDSAPDTIHTDGGSYIGGAVYVPGGDFIGRDQNVYGDYVAGNQHIYQADEEHDVHGLKNPYLGLSAYTYENRNAYGGRSEMIQRTVDIFTRPGEQRTLLFITGASGSGKSSFVQAGLIPTLEDHYRQYHLPTRWAVMRPSRQPMVGLAVALHHLGLIQQEPFTQLQGYHLPAAVHIAPTDQISLLIIDQFEEAFTQSASEQRTAFFDLLSRLPTFRHLPIHIIATLRVDYLPDLFSHPMLYQVAKEGIDLRAMTAAELAEAIQQPIRAAYPNGEKQMEAELVAALAAEASENATYLPLLQVTCEDLWRRGSLKRAAYGTLTDAIRRRAEDVFSHAIDESGNLLPRSAEIQTEILRLFLGLVDVSLNDGVRRDVRRRRSLKELTRDQADLRRLVDELISQRLLSTTRESDLDTGETVESVDIIHESLIANWSRLQQQIETRREQLQQRVRFEDALEEWRNNEQNTGYLLTGVRLAEAEALQDHEDIALQNPQAQDFLRQSIARREFRRRRQQRFLLGVVSILTVLLGTALAATWWAIRINRDLDATNDQLVVKVTEVAQAVATAEAETVRAEVERDRALAEESQRLSARALEQLTIDPVVSLHLSLRALPTNLTAPDRPFVPEALLALAQALQTSLERDVWQVAAPLLTSHVSRNQTQLVIAGAGLWTLNFSEERPVQRLQQPVTDVRLHERNDLLAAYNAETFWLLESGILVQEHRFPAAIECAVWHPTQRRLALCVDNAIQIWNGGTFVKIAHPDSLAAVQEIRWSGTDQLVAWAWSDPALYVGSSAAPTLQRLDLPTADARSAIIYDAGWSPDGRWLVATLSDGSVILWDRAGDPEPVRLTEHTDAVFGVKFLNNRQFLTWSGDGTARRWDVGGAVEMIFDPGTGEQVTDVYLIDPGTHLLLILSDGQAEIWDLAEGQQTLRLEGHERKILDFALRGDYLATSGADGTARIWRVKQGDVWQAEAEPIVVLHAQMDRGQTRKDLFGVRWLPNGRLLTYGVDGSLRQWQIFDQDGLPLCQGQDRDGVPRCFGLSKVVGGRALHQEQAMWLSDGSLVTVHSGGVPRRWSADLQTQKILPLTPHNARLVEISANGPSTLSRPKRMAATPGGFNFTNRLLTSTAGSRSSICPTT